MSKTIFYSGRAVSVSYLNSAQYLGPSNPGVVFVPNPINDWEYPLLTGTSLDLPNLQQYFVTTTANQTINGTKTFTSIPEFPASSLQTGSQGVNVTRLVTDLGGLNTTLSDQIATNNAAINAGINALATDLNTNYVTLSTNQAITGTKTFTSVQVPANPSGPLNPISLGYFDSKAVQLSGNQTIDGTKTFTDIQVPTPNSAGDAVNLAFLQAAISSRPIIITDNASFLQLNNTLFQAKTENYTAGTQVSNFIFPIPYTTPPIVVFCQMDGDQTASFVLNGNPTTTGFSISFRTGSPIGGAISWYSFGYKA